jgi:ATP-dependent DNA ligase
MSSTTLYKLNNLGSVSWWRIEPLQDGSGYKTSWGNDHNTISTNTQNVAYFSDPSPRALDVRIEAEITKQLGRKGYSRTIPTSTPELPMLAKLWKDGKEQAEEWQGYYIQPKIDGHRAIATAQEMHTRQNVRILSVPHISLILDQLVDSHPQMKLDGELYIPGADLPTVQSAVRRSSAHPILWGQVRYAIFDVVDTSLPFHLRLEQLHNFYATLLDAWETILTLSFPDHIQKYVARKCPIDLVATNLHHNTTSFKEEHDRYVEAGYEGLIIRNPDGMYRPNYRSYDLLKYKDFMDTEFEIVDIKEARNMCGVYVCRAPNGDTFDVNPASTASFRRRILKYKENYIGRMVTVKYEKMSPGGKPLKPTAHALHPRKKETHANEDYEK